MTPLHPSYAFVAFCRADRGHKPGKCAQRAGPYAAVECPSCGNVDKNHTRSWATVALVREQGDIAELHPERNPYRSCRTSGVTWN